MRPILYISMSQTQYDPWLDSDPADSSIAQAVPVDSLLASSSVPRVTDVDYQRFSDTYPAFRSSDDIRAIVIEAIVCGHYDGVVELVP